MCSALIPSCTADAETLRSYASELSVKLSVNGVCFFHHSNLGSYRDASGQLTVENSLGRCDVMTAGLWGEFCEEAGLQSVAQELIDWGHIERHDCISVTARPASRFAVPHQTQVNSEFMRDMRDAYRTAEMAKLFGPRK